MNEQINRKNEMKSSLLALIAFFIYYLIHEIATYATDPFLAGEFAYTWLNMHHLIQAALVLGIMILPFWKRTLSEWGINLKNLTQTTQILKTFTLGWIFFTTLYILISGWLSDWPPLIAFELNAINITQYLVFESIIVGISEELLFRGLLYRILRPKFKGKVSLFGMTVTSAGVLTAIIFAMAHIGFEFFPFAITSFNGMQVFMALALGIFYAMVVERTGSLLGAILAHNITDGWLSLLYIGITILNK